MAALESARHESLRQGTSEPPPFHKLPQTLDLPLQALAGGEEEVTRVWDAGPTAGVTKPGSTKGITRNGMRERADKLVRESLAWRDVDHVGLEAHSSALSSGQRNAELGVETTWLAPIALGPTSACGTCVLHKVDGGHVVWSGAH